MQEINPKTLCPASSWVSPSAEDFKALQKLMGWSGPDIAKIADLSINPHNGAVSSVQKWRKNGGTPFTVWVVLCLKAGVATLEDFGLTADKGWTISHV